MDVLRLVALAASTHPMAACEPRLTAQTVESREFVVGHAGTREWLRPVAHARTLFLAGSHGPFAAARTSFEQAAGWGPASLAPSAATTS
ncbi:hypothetical protein GCM10015535_67280 [Streptomyces gelaticus]|uniref:Uncharacterized protein n=1 Tax=Streptomyces gelaticus TaxID=285446 RepID=A0ABQ2WBG6_9ACTN|nr:hypothetical protein GCM10015535_67280 [Streptomyces gelaticus]